MSKRSAFTILWLSLFLGVFTELAAQQTPLFGQYFLNPYLGNPALVGAEEPAKAFLIYRRQWAEISGSPETQAFTLESRLRNSNVGLGILLYNDVTGIIGKTSGMLSSSVNINIAEHQHLRFGMSLGALQNRIQFDRILASDITDEALLNQMDQRTALNGNIGLAYSFKSLRLGAALDQLFENAITHENADEFRSVTYRLIRHYFTSISYDYHLNERWVISPMIASRVAQGLKAQTDFNLRFQYNNAIWLNTAYRSAYGFGLSLGVNLEDTYTLAYTYEIPVNDLSIIGGNTNEVSIGIRFHRREGGAADTRPGRVDPAAIEEMNTRITGQYERIDQLSQHNEEMRSELEESRKVIDAQSRQLEELKTAVAGYESELAEAKEKLAVIPSEEEVMEADANYFLVVGAFKTMENAKRWQALYNRDSGSGTRLVQSNSGTWFFVYTEQLESLQGANQKLRAVSEGPAAGLIIGNPWIFKKKRQN